jgi:uncharacterized protein (TIGR02145 family)
MTKKSIYNWIILLILFNSCNRIDNPNESWLPGQDWIDIRDNTLYKTVQIGNQIWMAENLNFISDSCSWAYNNETNNAKIYGRLYNWEAACKSCPTGWHLPTDTEWKELETYIGMKQDELDYIGFRGSNEGGNLKETGYNHWQSPNDKATDLYGFCALPAGLCENGDLFTFLGTHAFFWTSTQDSTQRPWSRELYYKNGCIHRYYDNKTICFSVRCIKDN